MPAVGAATLCFFQRQEVPFIS